MSLLGQGYQLAHQPEGLLAHLQWLLRLLHAAVPHQTVPLEITYLGSNFMGTLNNAKINVTQIPFK